MPVRIQRKRTKGWKMPANTVYVGRPSKWGNPFRIHYLCKSPSGALVNSMDAAEAVRHYKQLIVPELFLANLRMELGGRNLACWCAIGQPCHADVLLDLANPAAKPPTEGQETR
jgi:hypothetical protein